MKKGTTPLPLIVVAIGGLLLSLALLLFLVRRPASLSTTQSPTLVQDVASVPRVSLNDARAAFDSGDAIFLDVRSTESYTAGHIPGALSIPLGEIESRLSELAPDQWIITYCT